MGSEIEVHFSGVFGEKKYGENDRVMERFFYDLLRFFSSAANCTAIYLSIFASQCFKHRNSSLLYKYVCAAVKCGAFC